jgi:hypothetical protein
VIAYTNDDTNFYNEFNGFASSGKSYGCITFPVNGTTPDINGRYDLTPDTFANASQGHNYWVDIIFDDQVLGTTVSIYDPSDASTGSESTDTGGYTLGQTFSSGVAGEIRGIRFYKAPGGSGVHKGSLWTIGGTLLAEATFTGETSSGWQTVLFTNAVQIAAGTKYVAGYTIIGGKYWAQSQFFQVRKYGNAPLSTGKGDDASGCGRYTDVGSGVTSSNPLFLAPSNTSYFVDVLFGSDSRVQVGLQTESIAVTDVRTVTVTTAQVETLACSAASSPNGWTLTAGATKQAAVALPGDDATTYISSTGTANTQQQFALADTSSSMKSQDVITGVTVFSRGRRGGGTNTDYTVTLVLGANTTVGPAHNAVSGFGDFSTGILARPGGGNWTKADLDALEIRIQNVQSRVVDVTTLYLKAQYVSITLYGIAIAESTTVDDPARIAPTPLRIQAVESITVTEGLNGVVIGNATGMWAPWIPPGVVSAVLNNTTSGTVFKTNAPGKVLGVRFYRGDAADVPAGVRTGSLWSVTGTKLATVDFSTNNMGWNTALFSTPVTLTVGTYYVVSFTTPGPSVIAAPYHANYTHRSYPLEVPSNEYVVANLSPIAGQGCWDATVPTPPDHFPTASIFAIATFADVLFQATVDLNINLFETVTVSDPYTVSVSSAPALSVSLFESPAVTEFVKLGLDLVVQNQENASITEFFKTVIDPLVTRQVETSAVTDPYTVKVDLALQQSEPPVTVTEFLKVALDLALQQTEGPVVTEFTKVVCDLALQKAETGSVTEYFLVACDIAVRLTESPAVTESIRVALDLALSLNETVGVTENFKVVVDPLVARQVEDNSVTESVQVQVLDLAARNVSQAENATVTEYFNVVFDKWLIQAVDATTVTDPFKIGLDVAAKQVDLVAVTEYFLVALDLVVAVQELTGVVSEFARVVLDSLVVRVGEDITVTENLIIQAGAASYPLQQTETVSVTENLKIAVDIAVQAQDPVSCTDPAQITFTSLRIDLVAVENISVTDPFQVQFAGNQFYATAVDTPTVTDASFVFVGIAIRQAELASVNEQFTLVFTPAQYFLNIVEPVTVSDPCSITLINILHRITAVEQIFVTDPTTTRLVGEIAGEVFQEETTTTSDSLVSVSLMPFSAQVQTMTVIMRNSAQEAVAPYGTMITSRNQPARSSIFGEPLPPHDLKG